MRIALAVEYDGSRYHGWQRQPGLMTVQASVEEALSKVADHDVTIHCAGRTDTGVHATGQIIHFDSDARRSSRAWIYGANSKLPKDISVCWAKPVSDEFHARFNATARSYRYIIYNNPIRPATSRSIVTWAYRPMNDQLMHQAAQKLIGEHDFTSFRAIQCQSQSPMRNIHAISVTRRGDLVIIDITANAFLHHMVRNMAGVLMAIGCGQKELQWVDQVLAAKDRSAGADTAPPYGLYLVKVNYPEEYGISYTPAKPLFFMD